MKIILNSLLMIGFLFNNAYAGGVIYAPRQQAAYNQKVVQREQVVVRDKIIQFGDNIRIVGIPVEETDAEYYFRKSKEGCAPALSEGDMQKLAGFLADELIKRGYTGGGNVTPQDPKISEVEAKFTSLVNNRCAVCHSGENAKDGLSFIKDGKLLLEDLNEDATKRLTKEEMADLMFDTVLNQRMPKTGNKFTDEETLIFQNFKNELMKIKRGKQ